MKVLLIVGLGGFLGAVSRYYLVDVIERVWQSPNGFPWGIFAANMLGCLAVGAFFGYSIHVRAISDEMRLLVATGFLGSLTTFSTFGHQTLQLLRRGQIGLGLANIGASVLVGLFAVWIGFSLVERLRGG